MYKSERKQLAELLQEIKEKESLADVPLGERGDMGLIEYPMEHGIAYTKCIRFEKGRYAAAFTTFSKGVSFKHHHPDPIEEGLVLLYGSGTIKLYEDNNVCETIKMKPLDYLKIKAGQKHLFITCEPTGIIVITIPPDENYPKE